MNDKTQTPSDSGSQKHPVPSTDNPGAEPEHPVDVGTQEEAAKERSENGGYD